MFAAAPTGCIGLHRPVCSKAAFSGWRGLPTSLRPRLAHQFFGDHAGIPSLAERPRSHRALYLRKEFVMRVTGSILALSLLVSAAPAFAQSSGSYDSGYPYGRQYSNQNRYEYYPQQQDQTRYGQGQQGPWSQSGSWQQGQYGQNQQSPWQQGGSWQQGQYGQNQQSPWSQSSPYQSGGSWQQGQYGQMPYGSQGGSQSGNAPYHMGQGGQSGPVSSSTQSQIRQSLESSGFKNVTVLPQSYLIRATAPDGSRIMMQVSSDGLYGVVVNPTDQAATSGTGTSGGASTGGTSSSTGTSSTANTGSDHTGSSNTSSGNSGSGNSSSAGNTGASGSAASSTTPGSSSSTGTTTPGGSSAGNTTSGSSSGGNTSSKSGTGSNR
jgi:hypothetical protein